MACLGPGGAEEPAWIGQNGGECNGVVRASQPEDLVGDFPLAPEGLAAGVARYVVGLGLPARLGDGCLNCIRKRRIVAGNERLADDLPLAPHRR
jgi:hypothetical protein